MTVVDPAEISQATMMNMKLNNLEVARQKIMVTDDPTIISNKTGGIIGTHHNGKYYMHPWWIPPRSEVSLSTLGHLSNDALYPSCRNDTALSY